MCWRPRVAAEILRRLVGGQTLRAICRDPAVALDEAVVRRWIADDAGPGFAARYAAARDQGFEAWADEILEIVDDEGRDTARAKLQVETRRWLMAKLRPARWGDKAAPEAAGGAAPQAGEPQTRIVLVPVKDAAAVAVAPMPAAAVPPAPLAPDGEGEL